MKVICGSNVNDLTLKDPVYFASDGTVPVLSFEAAAPSEMTVDKALCVRIWVEGQDSRCVATIGSRTFEVKLIFAIRENR